MQTQVFEGTLEEVRQKLIGLRIAADKRLRLVLSEAPEAQPAEPKRFIPSEFRNGVPLLPKRPLQQRVTSELINDLLDEAE